MTKTLVVMLALTLTGQANALPSTTALPQASGGFEPPHAAELQPAQRGCLSLNQAVQQVRRQVKGRIVSAETRMQGNREVHVIKVLTDDGKVVTRRVAGCSRN